MGRKFSDSFSYGQALNWVSIFCPKEECFERWDFFGTSQVNFKKNYHHLFVHWSLNFPFIRIPLREFIFDEEIDSCLDSWFYLENAMETEEIKGNIRLKLEYMVWIFLKRKVFELYYISIGRSGFTKNILWKSDCRFLCIQFWMCLLFIGNNNGRTYSN